MQVIEPEDRTEKKIWSSAKKFTRILQEQQPQQQPQQQQQQKSVRINWVGHTHAYVTLFDESIKLLSPTDGFHRPMPFQMK
jgi:hypothetical protein